MSDWKDAGWKSFEDMKAYAEKIAHISNDKVLTDEDIKNEYFDIFYPTSLVWNCNALALAFRNFLSGATSEDDLQQAIKGSRDDWDKLVGTISELVGWQSAANKEMEAQGITFGQVDFKCPHCGAPSHYYRESTPENPSHNVTIRGYCEGCGFNIMN